MDSSELSCRNERRRRDSRQAPLFGLDFIEVDLSADHATLQVFFLGKAPRQIAEANVRITGGRRIRDIRVKEIRVHRQKDPTLDDYLEVVVHQIGDASMYTFSLAKVDENGHPTDEPMDGFDPRYDSVDFSFRAGCPTDLDCKTPAVCPPPLRERPEINYLAKDYESFRQLILDRLALTMPEWREMHVPDIGMALVETLAYVGDYLSYHQDAVATEAYLGTARQRISVRRHARLLDYFMHDGCNARAFVFFQADVGVGQPVPRGTTLLTQTNAPRGRIADDQEQTAITQGSQAFQTLLDITAHIELNQINFYTWSDEQCCLQQGATKATLEDNGAGGLLQVGDLLLFEEILGSATGFAADAIPTHRHVVRLTSVLAGRQDPLNHTNILEIAWDPADALPFPLCISAVIGTAAVPNLSVARGNIALADHGFSEPVETLPDVGAISGPYRPELHNPGLTFRVLYDDHQARQQPAAVILIQDARQALPAITLGENGSTWTPRRDLLSSSNNALDFVVEMRNDDTATLRFGDGILGSNPSSGLKATYRTGNGT